MMTDETAKALIEALNRFSGALEKLQGCGGSALGGGIHIHHHGLQPMPVYQNPYPSTNPYFPTTCGGSAGGFNQ